MWKFEDLSPEDDKGFRYVSHIVPNDLIVAFTSDCNRKDCRIAAQEGGGTLMARTIWYDRDGVLHDIDPNHMKACLCCLTCWKRKRAIGTSDLDYDGNMK